MYGNRQAASPPEQFTSAKTTAAIPIRHPAVRDALVQFSLSPAIRSIDYIPSAIVASELVDLGAIIVQGESDRVLIDIVEARPIRDLEDEGLALIAVGKLHLRTKVVTFKDLRREPRYTNSRSVWRYNKHHVALDLRIRILKLLLERQSMKLGQLLEEVQAGPRGSQAVMALACSDLLELDLDSQPLGPTTFVRSRTPLPDRVEPPVSYKKRPSPRIRLPPEKARHGRFR